MDDKEKKEVANNIVAKAKEFNKAIAEARKINIYGRYGFTSTDGIFVEGVSEINPIIFDE